MHGNHAAKIHIAATLASGWVAEPGDQAGRALHMALQSGGQFLARQPRLQRLRVEVGGDQR